MLPRPLAHAWLTLMGIIALVRLALRSRLRLKGPYWSWRMHTAFGKGMPSRIELVRSVLDYGRWVHAMRRAARGG